MGLFDKKFCKACGEKKGLFGEKLKDGNYLCSKCSSKHVFPFSYAPANVTYRHKPLSELTFDEYESLVAERDNNREELQEFCRTNSYCKSIQIDEDAREMVFISDADFENQKQLIKFNPPIFKTENLSFARVTFSENEESTTLSGKAKVESKIYLVLGFVDPLYDIIRIEVGKLTVKSGFFGTKTSVPPELDKLMAKLSEILSWEVSWSAENDVMTPAVDMDAYWRLAKKAKDYGYLTAEDIRTCLHNYYGRDRKMLREAKKMYGL